MRGDGGGAHVWGLAVGSKGANSPFHSSDGSTTAGAHRQTSGRSGQSQIHGRSWRHCYTRWVRCPFCSTLENKVIDSRLSQAGEVIRRRRECEACGRRYTTYERVEVALPLVMKKDGRRQPFDRDRILAGLRRSCAKRDIPADARERGRRIEAGNVGGWCEGWLGHQRAPVLVEQGERFSRIGIDLGVQEDGGALYRWVFCVCGDGLEFGEQEGGLRGVAL